MSTPAERAFLEGGGDTTTTGIVTGSNPQYVGAPDIPGTIINPDALTGVGAGTTNPALAPYTPGYAPGAAPDVLAAPVYTPGELAPGQPIPPRIEPGGPGPKPVSPLPDIPYEPPGGGYQAPRPGGGPIEFPPIWVPGAGVSGVLIAIGGLLFPRRAGYKYGDWPGGPEDLKAIPIPKPIKPGPTMQPFPPLPRPELEPIAVDVKRTTVPELFPPGMRGLPDPRYYELQPIEVTAKRTTVKELFPWEPFPAIPGAQPKPKRTPRARQRTVSQWLGVLGPFIGGVGALTSLRSSSTTAYLDPLSQGALTSIEDQLLQSQAPAAQVAPTPFPFGAGAGATGGCDCSQCRTKRKPGRKCLARAPVKWAGGPNKGKSAGTRCIRFAKR